MIVAVIPVKPLSGAKQRLSPACSPQEREQLCLMMLESLLSAVFGCEAVRRCYVVTPDSAVKAWLSERWPKAHTIDEPPGGGLNEAFVLAARRVEQDGAKPACAGGELARSEDHEQGGSPERGELHVRSKTMLFMHGDLPLASSRDIGEFAGLASRYTAVIVPDKHGTGTTALALTPPGLMIPAFGEGSFARHLAIMNDAKITYKVFRNKGLGTDVDSLEDLRRYDIIRRNDINISHH